MNKCYYVIHNMLKWNCNSRKRVTKTLSTNPYHQQLLTIPQYLLLILGWNLPSTAAAAAAFTLTATGCGGLLWGVTPWGHVPCGRGLWCSWWVRRRGWSCRAASIWWWHWWTTAHLKHNKNKWHYRTYIKFRGLIFHVAWLARKFVGY